MSRLSGLSAALRRSWRLIVLLTVVGAGLGALVVARATPIYAAHVSFLVSTRNGSADLATSTHAIDRARIYATLAGTDELAGRVKSSARVGGSAHAIAGLISGESDNDSAVVRLTVSAPSSARALRIAQGLAATFPTYVISLDGRGSRTASVTLTETSAPAVESRPVSPNKPPVILLGLVGGLVVGGAIAWLRDRFGGTVRNGADLDAIVDAPLLGDVPYEPSLADPAGEQADPATWEAFRTLRTNLEFAATASLAGVVVVSAADRRAGTTTVVEGLAAALAEDDRVVAAVYANPLTASPTAEPGLLDVVRGDVPLAAALRPSSDGPMVLGVGRGLRYALGADTATLAAVIAELRSRFDLVLIDAPPAGDYAEAGVLAKAGADGVVLVARHGRTRFAALHEARHRLAVLQIPVLGAVLTFRPVGRTERYRDYSART